MIPKIIHYCWLSDDPIPDDMQEYIMGWYKQLPDYEFVKWDFKRFDKNSSEWVKEAFDNKKYAFAADFIRLYAVYNFGGIYMDMDIEVVQPFGNLINNSYMFGFERTEGNGIEAGCFGAEKGNEFIGECLKHYQNRHFIVNGTMDTETLPHIMQKVYNDNNFNYKIFPNEYLTAKSYDTGEIRVTNNTRTIHHFAGSWIPKSQQKYIDRIKTIQNNYGKKTAQILSFPYRLILSTKKRGIIGELKYIFLKK